MNNSSMNSKKSNTIQRYCSESELPLFLNAEDISRLLGIALTNAYYLLRSDGFPTIIIGKRKLVNRDALFAWLKEHEVRDWRQKDRNPTVKHTA